jgi:hypothetical protein
MKNKAAVSVASMIPLAIGLASFSAMALPNAKESSNSTKTKPAAIAFMSGLKPGCVLPFDAIKTEGLQIDQDCSIDGNSGNDNGKRLESNAKNSFCIPGNPIPITYQDLKDLEGAADKNAGLRDTLKTSRQILASMLTLKDGSSVGEGTLVRFVAFILDAHNSNVGKGELVNCNRPDKESNDIHIELTMDPKDTDACDSMTAEMPPHFRPRHGANW